MLFQVAHKLAPLADVVRRNAQRVMGREGHPLNVGAAQLTSRTWESKAQRYCGKGSGSTTRCILIP